LLVCGTKFATEVLFMPRLVGGGMQPPPSSADPMAMTVGALHRLICRRRVVACSARVQPCECDTCVSIRAQAAHCLNAETKSRILLRQWLSPEQFAQYEGSASFGVVGSKTGKRYRIHHGRLQNVYELDGEGWKPRRCKTRSGSARRRVKLVCVGTAVHLLITE
jgi:hypothetical protein